MTFTVENITIFLQTCNDGVPTLHKEVVRMNVRFKSGGKEERFCRYLRSYL